MIISIELQNVGAYDQYWRMLCCPDSWLGSVGKTDNYFDSIQANKVSISSIV